MKIAYLGQSIVSDWNHGNAHFFRGLIRSLQDMGHEVVFYEPEGNWCISNLIESGRESVLNEFKRKYPYIEYKTYREGLNWGKELENFDAAVIHEWTDREIITQIGSLSGKISTLLFYHDTHHRPVTEKEYVESLKLHRYDGVIAFGRSLADVFVRDYGVDPSRVFVLHEAADVDVCRPMKIRQDIDLLFIGNWSDDRALWMESYFYKPSPFKKVLYGVRYPDDVLNRMKNGGVDYRGYLPNYRVPEMMCESKLVLHVHRGPYVEVLKGIPTIRVFEALACGACLVSSPWKDTEKLFREGDFVMAKPEEAESVYRKLLRDDDLRKEYGERGRETILNKHTCAHRAKELVEIIKATKRR